MAIGSYRRGVGLAPRRPVGHVHLAEALAEDGQLERAIEHYQAALQRYGEQPVPEVHARYAAVLARKNQLTKAANQYRHALASKPDYAEARANLGFVLIRAGEYEAARAHLELAAELSGDSAEIDAGLASAAMHLGDSEAAVLHYTAALRLRPQWAPAAINLAWILATHPDPAIRAPARAVAILEELPPAATEATPVSLDTLAAAYAATGRFEAAVSAAEAAAALARQRGRTPLAAQIEARRADYAERKAFIDSSLLPAPRS
jgi:tetratricopeptide (TPR) repeat protein